MKLYIQNGKYCLSKEIQASIQSCFYPAQYLNVILSLAELLYIYNTSWLQKVGLLPDK